jgi:hypothetical protein
MDSVQLKIEFENSLRRLTTSKNETFANLKARIASLLGVADVDIKYRDEESDLITIGSDAELREVLQEWNKPGQCLRLIVAHKTGDQTAEPTAETAKEEEAPKEPEIPFKNLATSFADPEFVMGLIKGFQSPALVEAVNKVAAAYLEGKGDITQAAVTGLEQLSVLHQFLEQLLEQFPVLRDLQDPALFAEAFAVPQSPLFFLIQRPGGMGRRYGGCGGRRDWWGQENREMDFHPRVFCDGCEPSEDRRKTSSEAGHYHPRGFIRGLRFKSQTLNDFDLCETCKGSGAFPEVTFGPFVEIKPGARWGGCRRRCRPHHEEAVPSTAEETTKPEVVPSPVDQGAQNTVGVKKLDTPEAEEPAVQSDSEWVPLPGAEDPYERWNAQLSQLEGLGFTNIETYLRFLEEEKGDMEKVVNRIIRHEF